MSRAVSLRQSMAWLHTWGSIWVCWLLYIIFVCGTLSVFEGPITRWMEPERRAEPEFVPDRSAVVRAAQAYLQREAATSSFWSIAMPADDHPHVRALWQDGSGRSRVTPLDPMTGEPLKQAEVRNTQGGHHFVRMHYGFQAGSAGVWLAGFATMAMLVALVSGVIIHKRIFKDFFTFRPNKGQRSWLDAHNAVAVLSLPFQLMIAYTGLVVFYWIYVPAPIAAAYPTSDAYFAELLSRPVARPHRHTAAPLMPLDALLEDAERTLGRRASFVVVERPGDASAVVRVFGPFDEGDDEPVKDRTFAPPSGGSMLYDGVTGQVLDARLPRTERGGLAVKAQQIMTALHEAEFGGTAVRWVYVLLGTAGAAMMASGAVLFVVKRRQKSLREFRNATPAMYRFIEAMNIGVVSGLCVASVAFLWANRLLPAGLSHRAGWEIASYFGVWGLAILHAGLRHPARAWKEQWGAVAALCLLLPVVNEAATGQNLFLYWRAGDSERLGVELTALTMGLICVWAARRS